MNRRIGDVELPLDPPEQREYCRCIECDEPIYYGDEVVTFKELPVEEDTVHADCWESYAEAYMGVKYGNAGDDL